MVSSRTRAKAVVAVVHERSQMRCSQQSQVRQAQYVCTKWCTQVTCNPKFCLQSDRLHDVQISYRISFWAGVYASQMHSANIAGSLATEALAAASVRHEAFGSLEHYIAPSSDCLASQAHESDSCSLWVVSRLQAFALARMCTGGEPHRPYTTPKGYQAPALGDLFRYVCSF